MLLITLEKLSVSTFKATGVFVLSMISKSKSAFFSICKQIVELHKGLIWAQSEPENGLSIFISLPIYKED